MRKSSVHSNQVITILTDPIPTKFEYYLEKFRSFIRPFLRKIDNKKPLVKIKYGGHYAVTRSLIEGLQKAKIEFIYNPRKISLLTNFVVIPSGLNALKQAEEFREKGLINYLAAGPNLVNLPSDNPELIGSPFLDNLILNCNWIKVLYCLEMPHLDKKTIIWPAGIDENFWNPSGNSNEQKTILFYHKRPEKQLYEECKKIALENEYQVEEIFYGQYDIEEYKLKLNRNSVLVHFVEQETQGISLLESWAMNVPTLIWNPGYYHSKGINFVSSSAPYLNQQTGMFFRDIKEFENCLATLPFVQSQFSPREWVLKNMTDTITSKNLINSLKTAIGK